MVPATAVKITETMTLTHGAVSIHPSTVTSDEQTTIPAKMNQDLRWPLTPIVDNAYTTPAMANDKTSVTSVAKMVSFSLKWSGIEPRRSMSAYQRVPWHSMRVRDEDRHRECLQRPRCWQTVLVAP